MSKKKPKPLTAGSEPITTAAQARAWAAARGVTEIECLVPDLAGVARGKIMPAAKFFEDTAMALPSSIFMQTISGEYPEETAEFRYDPSDGDIELRPDFSTLCAVPWASDPTAQVIHDAVYHDGRPVEIAPRQVLKRVVDLYHEQGWTPVVAPELEFYLVKRNTIQTIRWSRRSADRAAPRPAGDPIPSARSMSSTPYLRISTPSPRPRPWRWTP